MHVHTHENNTWRFVIALCLFVCSVSSVSSSFDSLHITLWLKCLEFVPHSSRLMHTLTDSLFDFSIHFTFLLFIIFSFQHFLLLFTFLEASRQQSCAVPLRSRVTRTTRTPPQKFILEESTRKKDWEHNKGDEFIFPVTDGTAKFLGRDYDFRDSTLRQEHTARSEDFSTANRESLNRQNQQMSLEPGPTRRFKVTSSIVITMNLEFNCVPKEETFPVHWNTLM